MGARAACQGGVDLLFLLCCQDLLDFWDRTRGPWDVCRTGKWCGGLREWTKVRSEESTGARLNRGPLRGVELPVSFLHQLKDSRHVSFLFRGQRLRGRGQEAVESLRSEGTLGRRAGHGDLSVECGLGYSSRSEESGAVHFLQSRSLYSCNVTTGWCTLACLKSCCCHAFLVGGVVSCNRWLPRVTRGGRTSCPRG